MLSLFERGPILRLRDRPDGLGHADHFRQHFNVDLVQTMNLIGDQSTSDGQALSALDQDLANFEQDGGSSDSTVAGYASSIADGIRAYEGAIRQYGLTAATNDHFGTLSAPIAAIPTGYCG